MKKFENLINYPGFFLDTIHDNLYSGRSRSNAD